MPGGFHSDQTISDGLHSAISLQYASSVERAAATGFDSNDLLKLAHQQDDNSVWLLIATTPVWFEMTATALAGSVGKITACTCKSTPGTIPKGSAVYIVGYDTGMDAVTVELAQADSMGTMPAFGIAEEALTDTVEGATLLIGLLEGVDTSAFAAADTLYISDSVAGGLTNTKPTGATQIQQIGVVGRVDATVGNIAVNSTNRVSGLPNLADGRLWIGNSSGVAVALAVAGDVAIDNAGTSTIGSDTVTNAKAANMAAATIKGNNTGGAGDPIDLTATQATAMLDVLTATEKGLAPLSGGGTANFLRADGTWADPGGGDLAGHLVHVDTNTDETLRETTSATGATFATTTFTAVAADYKISWYYSWSRSTAGSSIQVSIRLDPTGVATGGTALNGNPAAAFPMQVEAKDTTDRIPVSGHVVVALTAGSHTIQMDFAAEGGGGTSRLRKSVLTIERIEP